MGEDEETNETMGRWEIRVLIHREETNLVEMLSQRFAQQVRVGDGAHDEGKHVTDGQFVQDYQLFFDGVAHH